MFTTNNGCAFIISDYLDNGDTAKFVKEVNNINGDYANKLVKYIAKKKFLKKHAILENLFKFNRELSFDNEKDMDAVITDTDSGFLLFMKNLIDFFENDGNKDFCHKYSFVYERVYYLTQGIENLSPHIKHDLLGKLKEHIGAKKDFFNKKIYLKLITERIDSISFLG